MCQENVTSPLHPGSHGAGGRGQLFPGQGAGPGVLAATSASPEPNAAPREAAEHLV